ncbi:molybdopterin-containing oxidoreductase family protein [Elioraea thermophila]|uniref:molybdopterin-containing oxidoreductase family protein n=1 Tax=Elioraea thermophila TaxID=2185104 RepID=UPI000DF461D7|nr:molybdopterin-dependent oxidoreductase [Elioraea thermophila]
MAKLDHAALGRRAALGGLTAAGAAAVLLAEGWADAAQLFTTGIPDRDTLNRAGFDLRHTSCLSCSALCGLTALVRLNPRPGERPFVLFGNQDPNHPQRGMCGRGATAAQTWDSPLRLRKPLKRIGPRGSGRFEEISWEQAFDEIAERMRALIAAHGIRALCFTGHIVIDMDEGQWLPLGLGAPNVIAHHSTCNTPGTVARRWVLGAPYAGPPTVDPDFEHARFILFPGRTLHAPIGHQFLLAKAKAKGAKVAFLNPAHPEAAFANGEWIPCRPGTDAAFLLGVAHVLVRDRLYDETFLRRHTNLPFLLKPDGKPLTEADLEEGGEATTFMVFDAKGAALTDHKDRAAEPALAHESEVELKDGTRVRVETAWNRLLRHLADYTPERAAAISDTRPEVIERIARTLAELRGVVDDTWYSARNGNDADAVLAVLLVNGLLGNFDRPGGLCFRTVPGLPPAISRAPDGTVRTILGGELKLPPPGRRLDQEMFPETNATFEAVVKSVVDGDAAYAIRGLFLIDATLFARDPNTRRIQEMLAKLDLVVVTDILHQEVCDWADYVLPSDWIIERSSLHTMIWSLAPAVARGTAVTDPPPGAEVRPLSWISFQILRRLYPDRAAALGWQPEFEDVNTFKRAFLAAIEERQIAALAQRWRLDPAWLREELLRKGYHRFGPITYGTVPYERAPPTPSGKVELYAFHPVLRGLRETGFPRHVEPDAYTLPSRADEFVLVSGKSPAGSSAVAGLAFSSQFLADNAVWMNPEDARRLGIRDGETVELSGLDTGWQARTRIRVTARVHRGVLFAYSYVGGHRQKLLSRLEGFDRLARGVNSHWFATARIDRTTGAAANNASVRVRKLA